MIANRTRHMISVFVIIATITSCYSYMHTFAPKSILLSTISKSRTYAQEVTTVETKNIADPKSPVDSFFDSVKSFLSVLFPQTSSTKPVGTLVPQVASEYDNRVLIFGGTGRAGLETLKAFLAAGRNVTLSSRKALDPSAFASSSLADVDVSRLQIRSNVDITNPETLTPDLFRGVSQVVSIVGAVFNDSRLTCEAVDYNGNVNLINAVKKYSNPASSQPKTTKIVSFSKPIRDLSQWRRLDDVIMGGRSISRWEEIDWQGSGSTFARWSGEVEVINGGFCGTVFAGIANTDLREANGLKLTIRGDGNRYKLRVKVAGNMFQASFDTFNGAWQEISLPFDSFIPVSQTRVDYQSPGLPATLASSQSNYRIEEIGFVYSRFEYNKRANPLFKSTLFQLDVAEIDAFSLPKTQFILISSAGTERINRIDEEARMKDIPIVQLNPMGILNWKYKAEEYLRESGLQYTVVRATGLVPASSLKDPEGVIRKLDLQQGDVIAGKITRTELATALVAVAESAYAAGKTFEIRRDESESGLVSTIPTSGYSLEKQLKRLVKDTDRAVSDGWLPPLPPAREAPGPVTQEQQKAVLNDPRVKAQQARDGGGA